MELIVFLRSFLRTPGEDLEELNKFLRSHRILEETHELVAGKHGSVIDE